MRPTNPSSALPTRLRLSFIFVIAASSILFAAVVLTSCNGLGGGKAASGDPSQLSDNALYNIDSVRAAMQGGNAKTAGRQFLAAIDMYKNVKDPGKSIALFKKSIRSKISDKAYFELGNALLDNDQREEAIQAYHIAEKLNYSPLANVMYKLAAAYSGLKSKEVTTNGNSWQHDSLALHYMEVALQMGYSHPEYFRTSEQFARLKQGFEFETVYNNALSGSNGGKNPESTLWKTFVSEFRPANMPLIINSAWLQDHPLQNLISYDYEKFIPEMRNAKFSREVENEYYYAAQIRKDTGYTALLYAGRNNFLTDGHQNNPVFFLLVTYDRGGKIIDKMQVAGQRNFTEPFKVLTMQPSYIFEVKDFRNIFKDDPETAGYDSNYVVRSEPMGALNYRIGASGKFERVEAPLAIK